MLAHLGRIVRATPVEAHAIAWLHEVLERGALTEHELLAANLSSDELRTLRLVTPPIWARSDRAYLGHVDLIARAAGQPGRLARAVKAADLRDGCVHPRITDSLVATVCGGPAAPARRSRGSLRGDAVVGAGGRRAGRGPLGEHLNLEPGHLLTPVVSAAPLPAPPRASRRAVSPVFSLRSGDDHAPLTAQDSRRRRTCSR